MVARLGEDLEERFGSEQVFYDRESLDAGEPWPARLREAVESSTVLFCLLGRNWLRAQNSKTFQRRLDEPDDWVRQELESALARVSEGLLHLVPILVDGAELPRPEHLPESIRELTDQQAVTLRSVPRVDWNTDLERLCQLLSDRDFVAKSRPTEASRRAAAPSSADRSTAGEPHAGELATYATRARSLHEALPVAGFQTQLRVPIQLEDMYVPLRAQIDLRGAGKAHFADAREAEKTLGRESSELRLSDAFAEAEKRGRKGLVVLGDPGAGKTTQLKRVLLWLIDRDPQELGLPAQMLPVFLPLRYLEDLDSGLDTFIESQLQPPHLQMPEGFGARLLDRGNLLFLFDGLDEVADVERREQVKEWIEQAVPAYPDCRFVVSCRFAGYSPEVRLSEKFLELHVRPLDDAQAETFVRNWYRIVETGLGTGEQEQAAAEAEKAANDLIDRLREDFRGRKLYELTRNPLLLANLCLVHRDRGGHLPKGRARLYGECIDVLLESWRESKKMKAPVTAQQGRRVLQPAAYWLHEKEGRTRASAEELAPVIDPALEAIRWPGNAAEFLALIRDQSGLLTGWSQDRYGFMHLGFQEYLVAHEIRRRHFLGDRLGTSLGSNVLGDLAAHHGESWWQEVALLLVALEEPSLVEPFYREVAKQPAFATEPAAIEALLEDAAEVSSQPFVELASSDPGADQGLWQRQLAALGVLERLDSSSLDHLAVKLAAHPSAEIQAWLRARGVEEERHVRVTERGGVELVPIPDGRFVMGSPEDETGRLEREGPQHGVTLPGFWMSRYAVTNQQYGRFLEANPETNKPAYWGDRQYNQAQQPVVGVSWHQASKFAEWVGGRLPSEAEWEYAARAGTTEPYLDGSTEQDLDRFAWYEANSESRLHPVGEKEPNDWGLYDVLGNCLEWVEDDWHGSYEKAPEDGLPWVDDPRGEVRVVRGGAFFFPPQDLRAACRVNFGPRVQNFLLGFRVVCLSSGGP